VLGIGIPDKRHQIWRSREALAKTVGQRFGLNFRFKIEKHFFQKANKRELGIAMTERMILGSLVVWKLVEP